ncbi:hypothetical protein [Vibrio quintilis]|uniref:Uncharacterized protein n=1 Tax=Vibrio quintilis TaxID=1117707 RepID=A0A1M7Z2F7_9VIBR|nr:hypothetical protein [Vibrio quintilis]SHO58970.1 hypothetical protein VQ7734_04745 [Vibrio quintilis]
MESKYSDFREAAEKVGAAFSVIYVLYSKKLITWSSSSPSITPRGYNEHHVPIVKWQYNKTCLDMGSEVKALIEKRFDSIIDWNVEALQFNNRWLLVPQRVQDVREQDEIDLVEATSIITMNDPDFAIKANRELINLAEFLNLKL